MVYISVAEAQAWSEQSKLTMPELDADLLDGVATEILGRLAGSFVITPWTDDTNTPKLVRKIMAMEYVAWYINRAFSADEGLSKYANRLMFLVNDLIDGLIDGTIVLVDDTNPANAADGTAQFYPTDASSLLEPTIDDMSLGGPAFTMGVIW